MAKKKKDIEKECECKEECICDETEEIAEDLLEAALEIAEEKEEAVGIEKAAEPVKDKEPAKIISKENKRPLFFF